MPSRETADLAADQRAIEAPFAPGADLSPHTPPSPAQALAGKAHAPWGEVILLAGLSLFGSVAMDMYLPALPAMAGDLRASPAEAQATISVFLLGLAAGQLIFGPLSDRIGRRPPILGGVVLFLLASALCAVATQTGVLILARLLQAVGACAGMVVARAVVRDRYDDHEVLHVYSLLSLVFAVGPVLAPLIGGFVLGVANWRWIFALQALFAVAAGAAAFVRLPESRSEATRLQALGERMTGSYLALLRQPLLQGYLLTSALSGAALFTYITCAPRVVMGELAIPPAHFGWVFGANAIGLTAASQVNARLARRIPGDVLLQGSLLGAIAAALALGAFALTGRGGWAGILIPLLLVISSLGFTQPNASTSAMTVDRTRAGATSALLGTAFFGVGSVAGVLSGLVPGPASHGMAAVILGSLVSALLAYRLLVVPNRRLATASVPA
jgi:DHA1 family bicyclomycin/chloramphenicol resistance-like MFS transporter